MRAASLSLAVLFAVASASSGPAASEEEKGSGTGVELVGRDADGPESWTLGPADGGGSAVTVTRRWGFVAAPPGDYALSILPRGIDAVPVEWGRVSVAEGKATRVAIDSGIELVGRGEDDPKLQDWEVLDARGTVVAHVYRRLGFTPLPPGQYEVVVEPIGVEAVATPWGRAVVEAGATTKVPVLSGIELVGRGADDPDLRHWRALDGSGKEVARVYGRLGITPLPPGKYAVTLVPNGVEVIEAAWGEVEVAKDSITRVDVRSGIEITGPPLERCPLRGWFATRVGSAERVAYVYRRWGLTPLPPGRYEVALVPDSESTLPVPWGEVAVEEGRLSVVPVASGIEVVGLAPDDPEPSHLVVTAGGRRVAHYRYTWAIAPLKPGTYDVAVEFATAETEVKGVVVPADGIARVGPAEMDVGLLVVETPRQRGVVPAFGPGPMRAQFVKGTETKDLQVEDGKSKVGWQRQGEATLRWSWQDAAVDVPVRIVAGERREVPFDAAEIAARHGSSLFRVAAAGGGAFPAGTRLVVDDPTNGRFLAMRSKLEGLWLAPGAARARLQTPLAEHRRDDFPPGKETLWEVDLGAREAAEGRSATSGVEVDVAIESPEDRTVVTTDTVTLVGRATTSGAAGVTQVALVLDVSGSTDEDSGVDVDGDGKTDDVLATEVFTARMLLDRLVEIEARSPGTAFRVCVMAFSSDPKVLAPLEATSDPAGVARLRRGLDQVVRFGRGGTAFSTAIDGARKVFAERPRKGPKAILFLSDGAPQDLGEAADAAVRASTEGVSIHAIGIGKDFVGTVSEDLALPPEPRGALDVMTIVAAVGGRGGVVVPLPDPSPAQVTEVIGRLPLVEVPEARLKEVLVVNATTGAPATRVDLAPDGTFTADVPVSLLPRGAHAENVLRATAVAVDGVSTATDEVTVLGVRRGEVEVTHAGRDLPLPLRPAVNVILDGSHSMIEPVEGKPKYLVAREVVARLLDELPDGTNVGLRLYGHQGVEMKRLKDPRAPRLRTDDPLLCTDTQQVVRIAPLTARQRAEIRRWVDSTEPRGGRTLLVRSLLETRGDFPSTLRGPKTVVLVSDGIETCGGKIEDLAAAYEGTGIDLVVHVVGFDIKDTDTERQLQAIAKIGKGTYFRASAAGDLATALRSASTAVAFEVVDAKDQVVGRGTLGGDAVALDPGEYRVRLAFRGAEPVRVTVRGGERTRLRVDAAGRLAPER